MITRILMIIATLVVLDAGTPTLAAQILGKSVRFSTCTEAGVEPGCIVAKADDGTTYNVTGARRSLKANQWLQGTGIVSNRVSLCMQGSTIDRFLPDRKQKPTACGR